MILLLRYQYDVDKLLKLANDKVEIEIVKILNQDCFENFLQSACAVCKKLSASDRYLENEIGK